VIDSFAHSDAAPWEGDEHFRILAHPGQILVWVSSADGRCEFVSPSWLVFTGRAPADELGRGWRARIHPDDVQAVEAGLEHALKEHSGFRLKYRYLREDGVYCWFVNEGMARRDAGGNFAGHVGVCFDVTVYQQGEAELQLAQRRMTDLLRHVRLSAVVLDTDGRVTFCNDSLRRLLKASAAELADCRLFERYLAPDDRHLLDMFYPGGSQASDFPAGFETELVDTSGKSRLVSWYTIVLREFSGQVKGAILIGDDVTERRRVEAELVLTARVFEATSQAMVITDASGAIISVNQAFTQLTGYSKQEALGQNPRILKSGRHDKAFYDAMWRSINDTDHWRGDIWDRRKDGSLYPKFLSVSAIRDVHGNVTHYSGIFHDVTERKAIEERLDRLAHYDTLTGLPNRPLLHDRLDQAIVRAVRDDTRVALLYLDMDHFKQVNDTLGHHAGDECLKLVAQRIKNSVRAVDTVARFGGDEFVVLLPDIKEIDSAALVAKKIIDALVQPYRIEDRDVTASPSIGISIYPDDDHNPETLFKHADSAMYYVKQRGRGSYRFFHESR
jgi:diguanylate cyclase (GGDEF)-like protein/PAS domain S-box-containing protein